jgi:hypothetical protein
MSRYIGCKLLNGFDVTVLKYEFGRALDMYRIATEFGIGEYERIGGLEDRLILVRSDVERLQVQIQMLKETDMVREDPWFITIIETIRDFMVSNPEQDQFVFEGDL